MSKIAEQAESLGALRSKIELTLHTHHAGRLWTGRGIETGKPQIIGMKQFLMICGAIKQNASKDDPYADYWLIKIEDKIHETNAELIAVGQLVESLIASLPPELSVEENINVAPLKLPVYTGGQHGYLALRALIEYDRQVRQILLAHHVALIGRNETEALIRRAGHAIRSLCALSSQYPGYSGTTRDDFAAKNAKSADALQKFGELPNDVLSGENRSAFAPVIQRPSAPSFAPSASVGFDD